MTDGFEIFAPAGHRRNVLQDEFGRFRLSRPALSCDDDDLVVEVVL